ncbi:MAG: hypothetical protein LBG72_06255 [Spirochaetaceae bacterium]|jgi:hypothetical protein|nr:hypothetical protein [Spirochaetaceae bacterium]
MSITQTVEIPAGSRLMLEPIDSGNVHREVPAGAVITFTPAAKPEAEKTRDTPEYIRRKAMLPQSIEFINSFAEELNREAEDVLTYQGDIFDLIPPYEEDL